jgi:methylmalonyl-CoA/ethylmalonyl-CoA epimerase
MASTSPRLELDHVAVAVHSIKQALRLYRDGLGGEYLMGGDQDTWRWLQLRYPGGGKVELLEPIGDGFLSKFLDSRGEGLHHVTFKTDDIEAAIAHLQGLGFELVDVSLSDPNWKEAFLLPKDGHGTVVQFAESNGFPSRATMLERVRAQGPEGHPRWWPDPPPRANRSPVLRRVVLRTPSLPDAAGLFTGVLGGLQVDAGEGWIELGWPNGGRVALEHRPGSDAAVDRLEVEVSGPGLLGEHQVAGTRVVITSRD